MSTAAASPMPRDILRLLFNGNALSQAELSDRLGLSRPYVNAMVRELRSAGFLTDAPGRPTVKRGRPRAPLMIDDRRLRVLGIQMGHLRTTVSILSLSGKAIRTERIEQAPAADLEQLLGDAVSVARKLRDDTAASDDTTLIGAGVGLSGQAITSRGVLGCSMSLASSDFPVAERLRDALDLPIVVGDTSVGTCLAERWLGRTEGDFVYLAVLPFFRAVPFLNGAVYPGAGFMAGQVGVALAAGVPEPTFLCDLEDHDLHGIPLLRDRAERRQRDNGINVHAQARAEVRSVLDQCAAYRLEPDGSLPPKLQQLATITGSLLVNIAVFYDPPLVLLGGLPAPIADAFADSARAEMHRLLPPVYDFDTRCELRTARVNAAKHSLGALCLFLEELNRAVPLAELPR